METQRFSCRAATSSRVVRYHATLCSSDRTDQVVMEKHLLAMGC